MFACEHEGVDPDLIVTAKGIADGMPLSAVTGRAEIMDASQPGGLGGTFGGNPVACAAAIAVFEAIEEEGLLAEGRRIEATLTAGLDRLQAKYDTSGGRGGSNQLGTAGRARNPSSAVAVRPLTHSSVSRAAARRAFRWDCHQREACAFASRKGILVSCTWARPRRGQDLPGEPTSPDLLRHQEAEWSRRSHQPLLTMQLKLSCSAAALLFFLGATPLAMAQPAGSAPDPTTPEGKRAEGKVRYERGAEAYAKGRFTDAIDLFLEADALAPSAALSFNIARAYEKIGDGAQTLRWYRDFRRRAPDAKNGPEVDQRIAVLEKELAKKGVQQLTILTSPAGATVIVDDQPVGVTPFTGQFPPGRHRVVTSLRGYADTAQDVELSADHARDLNIPLIPDTRPPAAAGHAPDPAAPLGSTSAPIPASNEPDRPAGPRFGIWPWIGLGAGAVALGGAGAFELARRGAERDAESDSTQVGYKEHYDRMAARQTTARVLAAVGGALVVTGGVLLTLDLTSRRRPAPSKQTSFSLACLPDACGVRAWGQF
jgi:tetratricopeptide (TPR) repeat protein